LSIPIHAVQPQNSYILPRINEPVTLDGFSTESAWQGIESLPLIMHVPIFGAIPTEKTEILVAYDDDYFYAAARCFDREPANIQAPSKQRDELSLNNDWFGLILDTYNDNENALGFFTTPEGLRLDMAIFNDALGDFPINTSWNTFWDVVVVRNDEGWFVEMRIPFSSLRFQDTDGRVVMGLNTWRWIARKNEVTMFPAIPPEWGFWSTFKPSQAREVILEDIQSRKPLYVAPYGLGGFGQSWELNDTETAYQREEHPTSDVGLDVKYGLTNNLTLDLTVNTDFAQVEADDQQINLTRFSLFFPEKRLFFQERASNFEFNFGGFDRLFYSRQIGIYEDEDEEVPIYGGARIVGRTGPWDLGFLTMQTAPIEYIASENFGVLRVRRQVMNPNTYVGGMMTSRITEGGAYNVAYGLDGTIKLFDDDYLLFNWAQTFENDLDNDPFSLDPARFRLSWERRTVKGLGFDLSLSMAGEDYHPGVGYEEREDYTRFGNCLLYGWIPGDDSPLLRHWVYVWGYVVKRNSDGLTESIEIEPGWEFTTKSGYWCHVDVAFFYESVTDTFELSDDEEVVVPPGDYEFYGTKCAFGTPMSGVFHLESELELGTFYDGNRTSFEISPTWSVSSALNLSGTYEINKINFPERGLDLTAHIARIRGLYMPSTKVSLSAFIQYNSEIQAVIGNVRFRYNPSEGKDFYLVFDEEFNTNRFREEPIYPVTRNRTVLLKYTHTFRFER
jgi:hypothetical protein